MEFPTFSTASQPMATNWEEHYQDLSFYCQDPNSTKDMSIGRENIIGPPDDELNTPEIGEDFNFGSWSKPEHTEENYLWEDDNLGKIESDHYGDESVFSEYQNCDLPDETNGLTSLNYSPEETVANEKEHCFSTIVEDSSEVNCCQMAIKDDECETRSSFIQGTEAHNIHVPEALKPSVNTTDANIVIDSPTPAQEKDSRAELSLPWTVCENPVINTPDVLETLDQQPGFDIFAYILGDASGTTTQIDSQSHPISNVVVKEEANEEIATEVMDLDDESENTTVPDIKSASSERNPVGESHVVVYPSSQNTPVRILIKKHPETQASGAHSTQKRERKVKKKYIVVQESHDSSSDDEYTPPVKSRKRTASCSSKATDSECSRYRELRDRNNEASRKSRMNRKAREEEMKIQAAELEADNQKLRIRAEELEKLVNTLRKALLTAMVKGKD